MDQPALAPQRMRYLEYLPVSLFGSVMGLTGLSVAWRSAHSAYGAPAWVGEGIAWVAVGTFIVLLLGYGVKLIFAADAVRLEFQHPIAGSLFGTFFISLLLLPILIADVNLRTARAMWIAGVVGMIWFAWRAVSRWMSERQQPAHATPAWVVPVVGVLDIPLAIPYLSLPPQHALMVFSVAVGLFFAIPIFTLIFSRLLFEAPMPDALRPSLLILLAPFSVGFSAYATLTGHIDVFAEGLYFLMLFLLVVLLGRLAKLADCCPFRVSWWAVSFPLAASAVAAVRYAAATSGWQYEAVAWMLLALATGAILGLLLRTVFGIMRGELRSLTAA